MVVVSLTYEEVSVKICACWVCRLRDKEVDSLKVLWRSLSFKGSTLIIFTSFFIIIFQLYVIVPLKSLSALFYIIESQYIFAFFWHNIPNSMFL